LDINKGWPGYSASLSYPFSISQPFPTYLFTASPNNLAAGISSFLPSPYTTPGYDPSLTANPWDNSGTVYGDVPVYGLGGQDWQRYSKFETTTFPLIQPGDPSVTSAPLGFHGYDDHGTYRLLAGEPNTFQLNATSVSSAGVNDYLVARAGLMPHDVRIEAAIYAEEGSFFVIPGPWFNPNPNDRRDQYESQGSDAANQNNRLENYGNGPEAPFYGEPIDVRIQIYGSVAENMPPPMAEQAEWQAKWGWIPAEQGASGKVIPLLHIPPGYRSPDPSNAATLDYNPNGRYPAVPNLTITYDPMLATGHGAGFVFGSGYPVMRTDDYGRALPPIPRLPVSPTVEYEGKVK
jgi:hypothetical protein